MPGALMQFILNDISMANLKAQAEGPRSTVGKQSTVSKGKQLTDI